MFRKTTIVFGLLVAFSFAYSAIGGEVKLDGVKCPVSGKAAKDIDGSSVACKDGKVYFCCANCPKAYAKDKAKFAAKCNHQLVQTGQYTQVKCMMKPGKTINKAVSLTVAGVKIGFC